MKGLKPALWGGFTCSNFYSVCGWPEENSKCWREGCNEAREKFPVNMSH